MREIFPDACFCRHDAIPANTGSIKQAEEPYFLN